MGIRLRLAVLLAVANLAAACDDSPTAPGNVRLAFETVMSSSHSGFTDPRRLVIRSATEWLSIWQTLHAGKSPVPPPPVIDFDRQILVLAALGVRPNGCFRVQVTNITLGSNGELDIEVVKLEPGPSCACTLAITTPVHVVSLSRFDGPEGFREHRRQLSC